MLLLYDRSSHSSARHNLLFPVLLHKLWQIGWGLGQTAVNVMMLKVKEKKILSDVFSIVSFALQLRKMHPLPVWSATSYLFCDRVKRMDDTESNPNICQKIGKGKGNLVHRRGGAVLRHCKTPAPTLTCCLSLGMVFPPHPSLQHAMWAVLSAGVQLAEWGRERRCWCLQWGVWWEDTAAVKRNTLIWKAWCGGTCL